MWSCKSYSESDHLPNDDDSPQSVQPAEDGYKTSKQTQKSPGHVQVYILTSMTYSYKNQNGSHGVQIQTVINKAQSK